MDHDQLPDTVFLSVVDVVEIVQRKGLVPCFTAMAEAIEQDFKRWPSFDKCARMASHSPDGVIELMPIADASTYAFK